MSSESQSDLRSRYEAAFIYPYAAHCWETKRARDYWVDLEGWHDALAGPLSSVIEHDECAYVYTRDDHYFAGVNEPAELRARLRHWYDIMIEALDRFAPASPGEATDLASMRRFASAMWDVAEQACDIERARWEADSAKPG